MPPTWTCSRESARSRPRVPQSVTPQDSTTYTLTATGPGGTQSATARVTVTIPPPPPPPPAAAASHRGRRCLTRMSKTLTLTMTKPTSGPTRRQALTGDADFLKEHQSIKFTIEGKCDDRGSEEYNLGSGRQARHRRQELPGERRRIRRPDLHHLLRQEPPGCRLRSIRQVGRLLAAEPRGSLPLRRRIPISG